MKKLKNILFLAVVLNSVMAFSQNLVPNGSFEEFSQCPEPSSAIYMANHWSNPTGYSPDYFNSCVSVTNGYGIPSNYYGFEEARSGSAYAGIQTMRSLDSREYIQVELSQLLIENQKYCVSFYVSTADSTKYASNDIGVYFSNIPIDQSSLLYIDKVPHFSNNSELNPLSNTNGWTEVSGFFIASGDEKFLIIGNFKPDNLTDTTQLLVQGWQNYSYHYIDDVSLFLCDESSSNELDLNKIIVSPNPFTDFINIKTDFVEINKIRITDSYGKIYKEITKEKLLNINTSEYPKGVYFINIEVNQNLMTKKIIKI